jgi:hypothetical protein
VGSNTRIVAFLNTVQTQILIMYEHSPGPMNIHTHPTLMSTSERLGQLDLKIHEVSHQERLAIDRDVAYHRKNN